MMLACLLSILLVCIRHNVGNGESEQFKEYRKFLGGSANYQTFSPNKILFKNIDIPPSIVSVCAEFARNNVKQVSFMSHVGVGEMQGSLISVRFSQIENLSRYQNILNSFSSLFAFDFTSQLPFVDNNSVVLYVSNEHCNICTDNLEKWNLFFDVVSDDELHYIKSASTKNFMIDFDINVSEKYSNFSWSTRLAISNERFDLSFPFSNDFSVETLVSDSRKTLFKSDYYLKNNSNKTINVEIFFLLPLYYHVILSSLKICDDSMEPYCRLISELPSFRLQLPHHAHVIPVSLISILYPASVSSQYSRSGYLSFSATIVPNSLLKVSLEGARLLRHREYIPPDISRGVEFQPLLVKFSDVEEFSDKYFVMGKPFLLASYFPDATMPLNVITLASTVMAFLIGSLLNVLITRRSSPFMN